MFPQEFRPVCRYLMKNGTSCDFEILDPTLWKQSGVVYARLCAGKIVYIGSTDGRLDKRMKAHLRFRPIGTTQQFCKWAEGKEITIVAYQPEPVQLLGREIKVHRAIEAALIAEFKRPHDDDWFVARM